MATGGSFLDFRFKDSSINITASNTYNLYIEFLGEAGVWSTLPYGDAGRVTNLSTTNSGVATAEKLITSTNDFYILVTGVGAGACIISAVCQLDNGTKTITCEVNVTSTANSTGKYLLDSEGNRFSPIVSAETVYLRDRTNVKEALENKQDTLVSGTNIKTVNNTSLLGDGNITALTNISSYVKNNLTYSTSNTTYALSAYQGYLLNQNKENSSNKVTSISSSSTDTQYPSAKCVYDIVGNIENLLSEV